MSRDTLVFDASLRGPLEAYLPSSTSTTAPATSSTSRPFVTLTYAVSLDSQLAAAPGSQTALSGRLSKSMTHYLRTRHDAILVGSGTAIADNPTLNSRLSDALSLDSQPRPIVLDRRGQWDVSVDSKVVQAAAAGRGKGPWILIDPAIESTIAESRRDALRKCGGRYIPFQGGWHEILHLLQQQQVGSLMIEGGAQVINGLLTEHADLIDSVIITIAPVYLGAGGVVVVPPASRNFTEVKWQILERDAVMLARIPSEYRKVETP